MAEMVGLDGQKSHEIAFSGTSCEKRFYVNLSQVTAPKRREHEGSGSAYLHPGHSRQAEVAQANCHADISITTGVLAAGYFF